MKYEQVEFTYTEFRKQPGGKPPKAVRVKKAARALVVESTDQLRSIVMKEKGLPEVISLRYGLGPKEKSVVVAREDILSVNRQILKEKRLSDAASDKPLRAIFIDDLLTTEVNDNCTGTLARGTTGCGKTACVGNMLVHQAYKHQCGIIRDEWWQSRSFLQTFAIQLELERQATDIVDELTKIGEERETMERETLDMRDEYLSHQRYFKYYEFELGELNARLTVRLRELRRIQARQATGILAIASLGNHRPRPFTALHPIRKTEEPLKSGYDEPLARALNPATTYDRFCGPRPLIRDWHSGVKAQAAATGDRWADADPEVTEIRIQVAHIQTKADGAKLEVERLQPQYDTYIRRRSEYMEKANKCGFALTKLTRKSRVLCFNKETLEMKYKRMPWGGLLIDQKGSYNETVAGISKGYGKLALLTLIQVRPSWAKAEKDRHLWTPLVKWNLLSMPRNLISPAAYAEIFAATGASFKGSGGGGGDKNDYFVKASQNFIKVGIELGFETCDYEYKMAKRAAEQSHDNTPVRMKIPSLQEIYRFLTDQQRTFYLAFLDRYGLKELVEKAGKDALAKLANLKRTVIMLEDLRKEGNYTDEKAAELIGPSLDGAKFRVEFLTSPLIACMEEMETYFGYEKGQLSGLTGTIQNTLNPYVSDDMAEIFCAQDNTVEISDIDYGVVFCLAMSQKFAEERKYICVLLKKLIYFWNRLRNDNRSPTWDLDAYKYIVGGNAHYVFQDECQDTLTDDDQEIDKFRSQGMCAVFLTQSIVAMYQRLGGKERAQAFFNNVNNLYIGTAGDKDCAEVSAEAIGRFMAADYSYNRQRGQLLDLGGVSFSEKERFIIRPHEIRALPKFTFIVALKSQSSEKGAAVRRFLIAPRDITGDKPTWWWPQTLKKRDWWLYIKCQWNEEYPEFNRLPLGFNIKPVA